MMRKWWKNPRVIGTAGYWALSGLSKTLQINMLTSSGIDPDRPYIFAFWHGNQLLPSLVLRKHHNTSMCVMVSPSRDGGMLAVYLEKYGFDVVRGSSRADNIAGLIRLKKKLQQGASIGTAMDGPIGPMHTVKPGLVFLAQKYAVPIIPMGSALSNAWVFAKAWDKFELPKPFASAGLVLDEPYIVAKDMDIQQACTDLTQKLHIVQEKAASLVCKDPVIP